MTVYIHIHVYIYIHSHIHKQGHQVNKPLSKELYNDFTSVAISAVQSININTNAIVTMVTEKLANKMLDSSEMRNVKESLPARNTEIKNDA